MSIEYEISNILESLDKINDAFHLSYDGDDEELGHNDDVLRGEEAEKVRTMTSDITERCYDLISFLDRRNK